jgi:heat shock protein HslJ
MAEDINITSDTNTTKNALEINHTFNTTYWKLIHLLNKDINASKLSREAHIIFSPLDNGKASFHGASGCNEMLGKYESIEYNITIDKHIAMTRMACPSMEIEIQFLKVLGKTIVWNIVGNYLELLDSNNSVLARFRASNK